MSEESKEAGIGGAETESNFDIPAESKPATKRKSRESSSVPKESRGRGKRQAGEPKHLLQYVAVMLVACIGGIFVLSLATLLLFGRHFDETQLHAFNFIAAASIAAISYAVLGISRAMFQGGAWGFTLSVGGPLAGALAAFVVFTKATPAVTPRTVWVYANAGMTAGEPAKIDQFAILYRGTHGPLFAPGRDGAAMAGNVPWNEDELSIERVECVGFAPVKQIEGEQPPWKYPIVKGYVTIPLVKIDLAKPPGAKPEQVRRMVLDAGLTEAKVREPGKYTKRQVSLRIENVSDRPITFQAYDCVAAFDDNSRVGNIDRLWSRCKETRQIPPNESVTWGTCEEYESPSGWFALFVHYLDPISNRGIHYPIGVYNLFQIRDPKVAIERDGGSGVGFRLSKNRSRLEE